MTLEQACNDYYRFVLWCTSNEDATQATFLKVIRTWTPEQERWNEQQIKSWLRKVANNTLIDMARAQTHRNHEELGDEYIAPGDLESDVETRLRFRATLSRLTPEQRRLLLLADQGYTCQELDAVHAGMKSRVHRARKAFRVEWQLA